MGTQKFFVQILNGRKLIKSNFMGFFFDVTFENFKKPKCRIVIF